MSQSANARTQRARSVVGLGSLRVLSTQSIAIVEKELGHELRFKFAYLANIVILAVINLGLFATVYHGTSLASSGGTTGVNSANYVSFVILGTLAATVFNFGMTAFSNRLIREKYWETARSLLASPLRPTSLLLGFGLTELIRFAIISAILIPLAMIFNPTSLLSIAAVIGVLSLLFISILGIGLVRGVFVLTNENIDPLFTYVMFGMAYLSAFYYPASFVPSFLQPLIAINPVYYGVLVIRTIWSGQVPTPFSVGVLIAFAVLSVVIGTFLFQRVWRAMDIAGY